MRLAALAIMLLTTSHLAHAQATAEARAVALALRHVPRPVAAVVIVDPELAPDREAVARVDAFVVRERDGSLRQVVYINARTALMQAAAAGSTEHVAVLAAVIHHEMHHLRGHDEGDARRAERQLLVQLVERGVMTREGGMRHLRLLDAQPPPDRSAEHRSTGRPPRQ